VEVEIQVHRGAEALEERDGAALVAALAELASHAPAGLGEQRTQERAQDLAGEAGVVGAAVAQRVGEGEHPLADRHLGEHAVDEMRRGVGHAASAAGGAEAAPLAREGDEALLSAIVAVQAEEAVGGDAAAQVGAQLLLDEAGRGLAAFSGAGEEGL
jgi:uncharacterized protein (DUF697 family)